MKSIQKTSAILILITLILIGMLYLWEKEGRHPESTIVTNIIKVNNGYGYQILNGDSLLIEQKYIPAAVGIRHFVSRKDAQLVAELVKYKLLKGKSPAISAQELNDLNITILMPQ
ncbi:DUF4907 domain-containing protein [Spongiimicrobium sp. 3-5]|uniref:DUF4907 domain-containing protein n=1 Tax=Spongiimicrobium sp. 3-5 TaxID=3332596 RepID=UPI0039813E5C